MAIFDITYVGDMPYLKLEGGIVTGATTFNSSVNAGSISTTGAISAGSLSVSGTTTLTGNLSASTINGVTVGSSPKFTDTITTATTTGGGNAVTAISASNGALTVTKGTTFQTNIGKTSATITVANWNSGTTATVSVSGVTASNTVIVSPAPASIATWINRGVYCSAQASGTLTFTCTKTPTADMTVNVVVMN